MNTKQKHTYIDIPYPRLAYKEQSEDIKGLLFVSGIMGSSYLLFILLVSMRLGFL